MSHIQKIDGRQVLVGEELHTIEGKIIDRDAFQIRTPQGRIYEVLSSQIAIWTYSGLIATAAEEGASRGRFHPASVRQLAQKRREICKLIAEYRHEGLTWPQAHERVSSMFQHDQQITLLYKDGFPNRRTLEKWMSEVQGEPRNDLIDNRWNSGNKIPRFDADFETIVFDIIDEFLSKHDRMTIAQATRIAGARYLTLCEKTKRKPGPHGRRCLEAILESLIHSDFIKSRHKDSERRLLQSKLFMSIKNRFDRIELDCTIGDVFVVDENGEVIGRPVICLAIDCATGMWVGLQVSLLAPNSALVSRTMKEFMTPKDDAFFDKFNISNRVQCTGVPRFVVVDQGRENDNTVRIESILKSAKFGYEMLRPGTPWKKPFVERAMRVISDYTTDLPGATKVKGGSSKERLEVAKKEARLTLSQYEELLQKVRYDIYAETPRRRVENIFRLYESPLASWNRLTKVELPLDLPLEADVIRMHFTAGETRKVNATGIHLNGIQYYSSELERFVYNNGRGMDVNVRYDPDDIRRIAVWHNDPDNWLVVYAKDPDCPAISIEELRAARKRVAPDKRDAMSAANLWQALVGVYEDERRTGKTKYQRKKAGGRVKEKQQRVAEKSAASPVPQHKKLPSAPAAKPQRPSRLPKTSNRDDPDA